MANRITQKRSNVALLVEASSDYTRRLLRGVTTYMQEHQSWIICKGEYRRGQMIPRELRQGKCNGIIAHIETEQIAGIIRTCGIPVIDMSSRRLISSVPCVETDNNSISKIASEHLLERGFRHFGFVGDDFFGWSKLRCEYFQQHITEAGYNCSVFRNSGSKGTAGHWNLDRPRLTLWIQSLSKPAGIMAGWDGYGQQVLEACRHCGVAVPDEVAVIGVDNDEMECEFSNPPLSSIDNNPRQIGYECAALLDCMMSGKKVKQMRYVVQPIGVVMRQSTDVLAIPDSRVSEVIRFIREHACQGIGIGEVLRSTHLSRRMLEISLRKYLGHSPHQEILRVKFQHVKKLLVETNLTLVDIAERAGFEYQEYMSAAFKRVHGITPGEYRRQFRV